MFRGVFPSGYFFQHFRNHFCLQEQNLKSSMWFISCHSDFLVLVAQSCRQHLGSTSLNHDQHKKLKIRKNFCLLFICLEHYLKLSQASCGYMWSQKLGTICRYKFLSCQLLPSNHRELILIISTDPITQDCY